MGTPITRKIKVMYACQWDLMRNAVVRVLGQRTNLHFIGDAKNGSELIDKMRLHCPDIVLLDIPMPVLDGFETLTILKKEFETVKPIILTMFTDIENVRKAIELGAKGFIGCSVGENAIYDGIISVYTNDVYFNVRVSPISDRDFKYLSANEIKILRLLATGGNTESIGLELNLSSRTIDEIINKLKNLAAVSTTSGLVNAAFEKGFLEKGMPPPVKPEPSRIWRWFS